MSKKEINFVRCLKCQKILQCSRYDTTALLQHIREDHPEVKIVASDTNRKKHKNDLGSKADGKEMSKGTQKKVGDQTSGSGDTEKDLRKEKMYKVQRKSEDAKGRVTDTGRSLACYCTKKQEEEEPIVKPREETANMQDTSTEAYQGRPENREASGHPFYIPEDDLTQYAIKPELVAKYPEISNSEFCPREPNAKVIYTRRYKIKTPSTTTTVTTLTSVPRTPRKRHLYRTSIEQWRPVNGTIYCPKCGSNKRPLIKTKIERFTQNECCACFLLSCWPLCFLPCLLPSKEVEYLYCSNCQTLLGVYYRSSNCIKPNGEYTAVKNQMDIQLKTPIESSDAEPKSISAKSNSSRLPSIVVDGKELHPDMVARLQRYKKYGSLAGIDLEALTDDGGDVNSENTDYIDSFRNGLPGAPSAANKLNNKAFM